MYTTLTNHNTSCPNCRKLFNSRKAVNLHLAENSRCDHALNERVRKQRMQKHTQIDISAPQDNLNVDDPPQDWEEPLDQQAQSEVHAAAMYLHAQTPKESTINPIEPPIKRVRIEEISGEDFIRKEYPQPAGVSFGTAETVFEQLRHAQLNGQIQPMGPFRDRDEWELAEWLFKSGASLTQIDAFLKLNIIRTRTCVSYQNKRELLQRIDLLPRGAPWECHSFQITGDIFDCNGDEMKEDISIWARNPVECIRELIGNPIFCNHMKYKPEKLYSDTEMTDEVFNEMWTAEWWWEMQGRLPKGATVAPVILASDKTQLTQFIGDKQAWPVYMTLGNISKNIRKKTSSRAMILLGYLPITKLDCLSSKTRQAAIYRVFHQCMSKIIEPLIEAGKNGVRMVCADGNIRHVYPILAAYIADFPEQCLIAAVKENQCPICEIPPEERGSPDSYPFRNPTDALATLHVWAKGEESINLNELGLRPIPHPFWEYLPHSDIFTCLTPDLLHQLHKGVFKDHLVKWCITIAGKEVIDSRFQKLPIYTSLKEFKKGISSISQWTGREYKEMEKVFASLIFGAVPGAVSAVARAVVDFIYYASFESHSTETLRRLQDALDTFHKYKDVFIQYDVRPHFRIPKIHAMEHYVSLIRLKGTTDGFNTEISERLHIDCAKEGYRASNKKNYTKQMVTYLRRHESLHHFTSFLIWTKAIEDPEEHKIDDDDDDDDDDDGIAKQFRVSEHFAEKDTTRILAYPGQVWQVPKTPTWPLKSVNSIINQHGAVDFVSALNTYLNMHVPQCVVPASDGDYMGVYKQVSTELPSLQERTGRTMKDIIHAAPAHIPHGGKVLVPQRFDCVLVHVDNEADSIGLKGYRAARVRVFFALPSWFRCKDILAYVEWFTPFSSQEMPLRMAQTSYSMKSNGKRQAAVINLASIRCSCYLTPKFGDPKRKGQYNQVIHWNRDNIMDECSRFFFNSQISLRMFQMVDGDYVLDSDE